MMPDKSVNEIWNKILIELEGKDDERAICLSKELSDMGDWRGSSTLGYIFERKARQYPGTSNDLSRKFYKTAAHWYEIAISQGDHHAPHFGLASYYYYGLGGVVDFRKAFQHLEIAVEHISIAKIMLAELLMLGKGVGKNSEVARYLLLAAAEVGYPAAFLSLARLEKNERRYAQWIYFHFRGLVRAIKLFLENKNHPLLAGVGPRGRTFRISANINEYKDQS